MKKTLLSLVAVTAVRLAGKNAAKKRLHMNRYIIYFIVNILIASVSSYDTNAQKVKNVHLENDKLKLMWKQTNNGYKLKSILVSTQGKWQPVSEVSGQYTLLFSAEKPGMSSGILHDKDGKPVRFPEPEYRYLIGKWRDATSSVALNTAGKAFRFYPSAYKQEGNRIQFRAETDVAEMETRWQTDDHFPNDILVRICLKARKKGYFSLATPSLNKGDKNDFRWGMIPGIFQGKEINPDFVDAYAYGHGIPDKPVVVRERTAAALTSLLTNKDGVTVAVTAEPGTGRDPWEKNKSTQTDWRLGLSSINREGWLCPTLYHPVLGEKQSYMNAGDSVVFEFRYTIQRDDWYTVYKHVVNDIYAFNRLLSLQKTRESLSSRLFRLLHYVKNDSTSRWRLFEHKGLQIGAQEYLGGVYESEKDATKNADYGAMWMLANITGDTLLNRERLPAALNFKFAQQNLTVPFFKGAAAGQYYLYKSDRFTEEWGPYTEPIATTYYILIDVGNILLFEPQHKALKQELRRAADWLLDKMSAEGNWEIAYSNDSYRPLFRDQKDLRPTFYGMLVAYRILKDKKYLHAAIKGADWFVKNAVDKGYFLGVCGDARFAPDFATAQSAQALMELFDLTGNATYKQAALRVAQFYTTSIYSHPVPGTVTKQVKGSNVQDWQISQAGLSFEHGGILGSANTNGPILLASHAGMFVRLFGITRDSLFLNMARAAALGRDAFVDPQTGVASYYWKSMNNGAGPYPHHAWWQTGWIMDYLLSETALRSKGGILFPAGFMAPKVGPHLTYGFREGEIYGHKASLILVDGLVQLDNPELDYISAIDRKAKKFYVCILNNATNVQTATAQLSDKTTIAGRALRLRNGRMLSEKGVLLNTAFSGNVTLEPYGLQVYCFEY